MTTQHEQLRAEQRAFDAMVVDLLEAHSGDWVLFKDKRPVDFFSDFSAAYEAGLRRFGRDEVFLISEVEPPRRHFTSFFWEVSSL